MNPKKLAVYVGIPASVSGVLMAMYFSGVRLLESIAVMPYLDSVAGNSRREFGLVENLQNLILIAIIFIAVRSAIRSHALFARGVFALIATVTLFLFLEEIDYGLHYYELLASVAPDQAAEVRNFHNVGNRTSQMKRVADVCLVLTFVIAPLPLRRAKAPWLRFLAPDPYLALTLLVGLLTRTIAHALNDQGLGIGIRSNISEFREVITYYVAFLYVLELSRRDSPASAAPSSKSAIQA